MKIAVSCVNEEDFNAKFDPRFGRAPYFAIVDTEKMKVKFIKNEGNTAAGGAGIMTAQLVANQKVDGVISGKIGPKALQALQTAKMKIYYFNGDRIDEAINEFKDGNLILEYDPAE